MRLRKFTLPLALCLGLCRLYAQSYIPFPDSDAVWMTGCGLRFAYPEHPVATCDTPLSFGTDTVINGQTYHRLYGQTVCNWLNEYLSAPPPGTVTTGTDYYPYALQFIFRQDIPAKKVYQYIPNESKDTLLYDFNLTVGAPYPETILSPGYLGLMVLAHDSIPLNGTYYEIWHIGTQEAPYVATVIEGIGSSQGFGTGFLMSDTSGYPFESMYYLHCFTLHGNTLFSTWPGHFHYLPFPSAGVCSTDLSLPQTAAAAPALYPNPASQTLTVQAQTPIAGTWVTDMQGRTLLQQAHGTATATVTLNVTALPPGLYTLHTRQTDGNHSHARFVKTN